MQKEIGGYLDIRANYGHLNELDQGALYLSSGRHCLEFLLTQRGYSSLYCPYYTCPSVARALKKCNIEIIFYHINEDFFPIIDNINSKIPLLYTNYYGLMHGKIPRILSCFPLLILDNTQAFFSPPLPGQDTFYSPKKFFGLADGGILFPREPMCANHLDRMISWERYGYLLRRVDCNAPEGYTDRQRTNAALDTMPVQRISELTEYLLRTVDFDFARSRRRENWLHLDKHLASSNALSFTLAADTVPLFYPYLCDDEGMRSHLIKNRVYVPKYWPGLDALFDTGSFEQKLLSNLVPLPIDQRYSINDMQTVLKFIGQRIKP